MLKTTDRERRANYTEASLVHELPALALTRLPLSAKLIWLNAVPTKPTSTPQEF